MRNYYKLLIVLLAVSFKGIKKAKSSPTLKTYINSSRAHNYFSNKAIFEFIAHVNIDDDSWKKRSFILEFILVTLKDHFHHRVKIYKLLSSVGLNSRYQFIILSLLSIHFMTIKKLLKNIYMFSNKIDTVESYKENSIVIFGFPYHSLNIVQDLNYRKPKLINSFGEYLSLNGRYTGEEQLYIIDG